MYENKKTFESILVLIVDLCSLIVSMGLAFWLRYGIFYGRFQHGDQIWLLFFAIALYGLMFVLMDFSHHFFRRGMFDEIVSVVKSEVIFSAVLILALFVMHRSADLSRLVFGYQIVINTVVMYAARAIFKQYMVKVYRNSRHSNRLLVVTSSDQAENVLENLKEYNEWNRTIAGLVLTDTAQVGEINEIPVVAHSEDFLNYVIRNDVDEVFIIDDKMMRTPLMDEWVRELEQMGIIVDVNIDAFDLSISGKKTLNRVGKYAVVSFARNLFSTRQMIAKRALDIVGSLVGMVILGIATIFVAPAIKLDSPGPVFFGQTRVGKNGRKFTFYKFRSMYKDAEARKKELMASNEVKGLMFKMEDDPRITKVGKFIRKTSIDELPQFWNVLRGDMSLVGTRPPTVDEFEHYEAKHKCRLSMTPGLTGLWQISGRSDIKDFDEVVRLDMQYIDNWSILKDIKILILTVKVVLTGRGSR
ncbi:MAG: sugar transferase [Candidatus Copromonas sp.]|uniref:sugar transferase n=1 Tax=Pilosibacter fragilis TaxID=3078042 RepID=UPI00283E3599|nr:sugar transferase [Candidatus Copromonas sp.]